MNATLVFEAWGKRRARRRLAETTHYRFAVKIGIPQSEMDERHRWGDYHFAAALQRSLERRGHRSVVHCIPQWDDLNEQVDVVIHLFGLSYYKPRNQDFNILWIISHPDKVTLPQVRGFDLVLAASEPFAQQLRDRYQVEAHYAGQFTDLELFQPCSEPGCTTDLLFVGNSRRAVRPVALWASQLGTADSLSVYGRDWEEFVPPQVVKGGYIPYSELRKWYANAFVVLNDHWPDMRSEGFINNRIFDATAAGAFVISDSHAELLRLFPMLPCCASREELAAILARARREPAWRAAVIEDCRRRTLAEFTLEKRTDQLISLFRRALGSRPSWLPFLNQRSCHIPNSGNSAHP